MCLFFVLTRGRKMEEKWIQINCLIMFSFRNSIFEDKISIVR